MIDSISPIDTLGTVDEKLNYMSRSIDTISSNTNAFDGVFSSLTTIFAFVASFVTIAGLSMLIMEYIKRRTSKEWQRKIILDLIRHFMVNNAIIEVIRSRTGGKPDTFHPVEGVLSRFATLDSDTDLARFAVTEKNYEKIHDLSLRIRNYNNYVCFLDKHICDSGYPREAKARELEDVFRRSLMITEDLMKLCRLQGVELTPEMVHDYIKNDRYCEAKIGEWKESGEYCHDFRIPSRDVFAGHSFYDDKGLSETLDHMIRHQAALIPFVDY